MCERERDEKFKEKRKQVNKKNIYILNLSSIFFSLTLNITLVTFLFPLIFLFFFFSSPSSSTQIQSIICEYFSIFKVHIQENSFQITKFVSIQFVHSVYCPFCILSLLFPYFYPTAYWTENQVLNFCHLQQNECHKKPMYVQKYVHQQAITKSTSAGTNIYIDTLLSSHVYKWWMPKYTRTIITLLAYSTYKLT